MKKNPQSDTAVAQKVSLRPAAVMALNPLKEPHRSGEHLLEDSEQSNFTRTKVSRSKAPWGRHQQRSSVVGEMNEGAMG